MAADLTVPVTASGRTALDAIRSDPSAVLLATDFDGVLAPIVPDPDSSAPHPDALATLGRLGRLLGAVAVVTGRPADQAVRLGGFAGADGLDRLVVLGQYGVERWEARTGRTEAPDAPPGVATVRDRLPALLRDAGVEGQVFVEDKHRALVVHARRADDPEAALAAVEQPVRALAAEAGLEVEAGKQVWEVRAAGSDKGGAIDGLVEETGVRTVVYAGDDLGDVPAFDAVERQREAGRDGLLVFSAWPDAVEASDAMRHRADLVLDGPDAVVAWLAALADALEAGA